MVKKLIDEWKYTVIGLLVILLVGFILRFVNLTSLPVFADEAIYIRWAQVMKSEPTLRFLPLSDGKQPLFMWLMIPFLKFISDPLVAGRLMSVCAGLGTILGVFFASYLLFKNKKVALISSAAYALVPFAVFFDRMALSDSLLTMYGIWTFGFCVLLTKTIRLDVAMITGFFLGAALLTKSPALYFSLLLPTVFIVGVTSIKVLKWKNIITYLVLLVPTYLIGYGMYNILRLGPEFHMLAIRNMDYVHPLSHIWTYPLDPLKPFLHRNMQFYWILGTGGLFITWLLSYLLNYKKWTKELLVLSLWLIVPILISSEFSKTMTARYVLFSMPFFVILSSTVFLAKEKWSRYLSLLLALVFVAQGLLFNYKLLFKPETANLPRSERSGYMEEWTAGQGIREISDYLKNESNKNPNLKILVGTEGFFGTLPDGLQIYFDKDQRISVIGIGLELDKVPEPLLEAKQAGNRVFLVANDERVHTDLTALNLEIIRTYPKAIRPDGTQQSLVLYEVTNKALQKNK